MQIQFQGSIYQIAETIITNISDSFVDKSLKTGTGSGETRLYVSAQSSLSNTRFFIFDRNSTITVQSNNRTKTYNPCPYKGVFLKSNLLEYLEDVKTDYLFPKYNFLNTSDMPALYNHNLRIINSLPPEITFTIHDQKGDDDASRFYIGSGNSIWHTVRAIILPFTSEYAIHKSYSLSDPSDIIYFFEVRKKSSSQTPTPFLPATIGSEEDVIREIQNSTFIDSTEKETIIIARKGQGRFRNNVLSIMPFCPFTGISLPNLLRASHILPWKDCSSNEQRLDGFNGLSLTPTYDVLFDSGLISFQNNGALLVSTRLPIEVISALNLTPHGIYNICNINGLRNTYLDYHRNNVFRP